MYFMCLYLQFSLASDRFTIRMAAKWYQKSIFQTSWRNCIYAILPIAIEAAACILIKRFVNRVPSKINSDKMTVGTESMTQRKKKKR